MSKENMKYLQGEEEFAEMSEEIIGRPDPLFIVLTYDNDKLEKTHNYIQWLFPLSKPSKVIPKAPILSQEEIEEIKKNPNMIANIRKGLGVMLRFFRETDWVISPHNYRRISRILECLKQFDMQYEARLFYTIILKKAAYEHPILSKTIMKKSKEKYWDKIVEGWI